MNTTLSMKEYRIILEQIELTEEQQQAVSQILTEGLLDTVGRHSLIGLLKIIKLLWDAGWYSVLHPFKTVANTYRVAKKTAIATVVGGLGAGVAAGAAAIRPYVDNAYMVYQLGQKFNDIAEKIPAPEISAPIKSGWDAGRATFNITDPTTYVDPITGLGRGLRQAAGNAYDSAGSVKIAATEMVEIIKKVPKLTNWEKLSVDEKVAIMKELGLSSDAYGDLLRYVWSIASEYTLHAGIVLFAFFISRIAARFISKFGSNLIQKGIETLGVGNKTEPEQSIEQPAENPAEQPTDKKLAT